MDESINSYSVDSDSRCDNFAFVTYDDLPSFEWDDFISTCPGGWNTDRSEWMKFFTHDCGYRNYSFAIVAGGKIRMAFPLFMVPNLFLGKRLISGPFFDHGGPIIDPRWEHLIVPAQKNIANLASRLNVRYVEIRDPIVPIPESLSRQSYCKFLLSLRKPEENLYASLGNNVRRALKKANKACSASVSNDPKDFIVVWNLYRRTMQIHGTPPWGMKFRRMFETELELGRAHLVLASCKGACLGGALVWGDGSSARLEIAASPSEEARKLQVNSLLFWKAIVLTNSLGYERIDLTRTLKGSSHYNFKKRWGGTECPLPFTYLRHGTPPSDPRESSLRLLAVIGKYVPSRVTFLLGDMIRIRLAM